MTRAPLTAALSAYRRRRMWAVLPLPPPTLDTGRWVVATTARGLVLSVQPSGRVSLAPPGAQGPQELALLQPDRLVYAPQGAAGPAFQLAYCASVPNA